MKDSIKIRGMVTVRVLDRTGMSNGVRRDGLSGCCIYRGGLWNFAIITLLPEKGTL